MKNWAAFKKQVMERELASMPVKEVMSHINLEELMQGLSPEELVQLSQTLQARFSGSEQALPQ